MNLVKSARFKYIHQMSAQLHTSSKTPTAQALKTAQDQFSLSATKILSR